MTKLYTPEEAAEILSISKKKLKELTVAGLIRSVVVGGKARIHRRYTAQNIATFIAKNKVREVPPCQSTNTPTRHSSNTRSDSKVIDFMGVPKPLTVKTLSK